LRSRSVKLHPQNLADLFDASSVLLHGKADAQLDAKTPVITGSGTFRFL
jgi:hypothetical protein